VHKLPLRILQLQPRLLQLLPLLLEVFLQSVSFLHVTLVGTP